MVRRYEVAFSADVLQPKQRPRFNSKQKSAHTPIETANAEKQIAIAYRGASIRKYGKTMLAPKGVPVAIKIDCYTKAPKSWPSWIPKWLSPRMPFTKKPDWDNLGKTVTDALNEVAYADDAQVIAAHVYKHDMTAETHDHIDVTVQFDLED